MARRKRALHASGGSAEDDVNLTPMLDVVFILLIFFIVTAQFIKEPGVEISRTDVDNQQRIAPLGILVAIDENSDIYVDKQIIDPNEIGFTLREMREDNPKGKIVVQADNNARAEVLVGLMEAISEVDASTSINVSVEQN